MKLKKETMNAKQIILAIGIAIVFAMFISYGVETFYPSPDYDDTCGKYYDYSQEQCVVENGKWDQFSTDSTGFCNPPRSCENKFDEEMEKFSGVFFLTAIITGLIGTALGIFLIKGTVSIGLLGGGIFIIFIGTMSYWRFANDWVKFVALGAILTAMIYLGYKFLDKRKN